MNMQGFNTIFNADSLSDDFSSYKRDKIAKSFNKESENYEKLIGDEDDKNWSLDEGYESKSDEVFPPRAIKMNQLSLYMSLSESDASNICVSQGRGFKVSQNQVKIFLGNSQK
jgi:hypothetical protein